jgi:hypothetical protein
MISGGGRSQSRSVSGGTNSVVTIRNADLAFSDLQSQTHDSPISSTQQGRWIDCSIRDNFEFKPNNIDVSDFH